MAQTQIQAIISDLGINPTGDLMAKITVTYRGFGMEAKRSKTIGYVNITEWIKNDSK